MKKCCVPSCRRLAQSDPDCNFFMLPWHDKQMIETWVEKIKFRRSPGKKSLICQYHFEPDCITVDNNSHAKLTEDAVPTIFVTGKRPRLHHKRIYISKAYDHWKSLKRRLHITSDGSMANVLVKSYEEHAQFCGSRNQNQDIITGKTMVDIAGQFARWTKLRKIMVSNDEEVAKYLMDMCGFEVESLHSTGITPNIVQNFIAHVKEEPNSGDEAVEQNSQVMQRDSESTMEHGNHGNFAPTGLIDSIRNSSQCSYGSSSETMSADESYLLDGNRFKDIQNEIEDIKPTTLEETPLIPHNVIYDDSSSELDYDEDFNDDDFNDEDDVHYDDDDDDDDVDFFNNSTDSDSNDIPEESPTGRPRRKAASAALKKSRRIATKLLNEAEKQHDEELKINKIKRVDIDNDYDPSADEENDDEAPPEKQKKVKTVRKEKKCKKDVDDVVDPVNDVENGSDDQKQKKERKKKYKKVKKDSNIDKSVEQKSGKKRKKRSKEGDEPPNQSNELFCDVCDYSCNIEGSMERHMYFQHRIPPPNGLLPCEVCGIVFLRRYRYTSHINKIHDGAPDLVKTCQFCGDSLAWTKYFRHLDTVHADKLHRPYVCEHCGHACADIMQFTGHKERHTKTKDPLQCTYEGCTKVVRGKMALRQHMRIVHLGQGPKLKCTFPGCDLVLSNSHNLKVHLLQHTGVHPFACKLCDYTAKQKVCLKLHMKSHHSGVEYTV